jgi:hypothetical protein
MSKIVDLFAQDSSSPSTSAWRPLPRAWSTQGAAVVAVDWQPPADGYVELDSPTRRGCGRGQRRSGATHHGRPAAAGGDGRRARCDPRLSWPADHPQWAPHRLGAHVRPDASGAVIGALIYEGLADTPEKAAELAASGAIEFAPCHHFNAVGPMAGIISPSMPVFIVRNEATGDPSSGSGQVLAYATQNEGLGRVLRYGAYGPEVIQRLRWMADRALPGPAARAGERPAPSICAA